MKHQSYQTSNTTPVDTIAALTSAINRGDLDSMADCFAPDAVLVVQALAGQSGQTANGIAAIRDAYKGFVSLKPTLVRQSQKVIESENVALHFSKWHLKVTSPDGSTMERSATSTDVLRREPGGRWLVVIYNPYGIAILE